MRHGTPVLWHTRQKHPRVHAGRAVELRLLAHPPGAADAIGRWAAQHGCALCGPNQSEGARLQPLQPLQPLHARESSAAPWACRRRRRLCARAVRADGAQATAPAPAAAVRRRRRHAARHIAHDRESSWHPVFMQPCCLLHATCHVALDATRHAVCWMPRVTA